MSSEQLSRTPSSDATRHAVLISGGLDSAILLGDRLKHAVRTVPIYVRGGFFWEETELAYLRRFLHALRCEQLEPLNILDVPVADLQPGSWNVNGHNVPDAHTPDEAVYIPGRNVILLAKSMVWCHLNHVASVALAVLGSNPFPDATPAFFASFESSVNAAIQGSVRIERPFAQMHKRDVMRLGQDLPLEWTFSCISPIGGRHCGACNKCAERKLAFIDAGLPDPTRYANALVGHTV